MPKKTLPIVTLPYAKLRQKSKAISSISAEVHQLTEDMIASTLEWEANREHEVGVALAAIQVGQLTRAIVVREDFEDRENKNFKVFLNPRIVKCSGEVVEDYEGCLSVKDIYGLVPRYSTVEFTALTLEGKTIHTTVDGFMARVLQHEIDHTDGVLFIDHIKDKDAFFNLTETGELEKVPHETILKSNILW